MNNSKNFIIEATIIIFGIIGLIVLAAPLKADLKEIDKPITDDEEREKFYKEAEEELKIFE